MTEITKDVNRDNEEVNIYITTCNKSLFNVIYYQLKSMRLQQKKTLFILNIRSTIQNIFQNVINKVQQFLQNVSA